MHANPQLAISAKVFKIVLLGDAAVGKTNLVHQYLQENFSHDYVGTLGATCDPCKIVIGGTEYEFDIWTGSLRFTRPT
jgi:GTPase SAR1 family protein